MSRKRFPIPPPEHIVRSDVHPDEIHHICPSCGYLINGQAADITVWGSDGLRIELLFACAPCGAQWSRPLSWSYGAESQPVKWRWVKDSEGEPALSPDWKAVECYAVATVEATP